MSVHQSAGLKHGPGQSIAVGSGPPPNAGLEELLGALSEGVARLAGSSSAASGEPYTSMAAILQQVELLDDDTRRVLRRQTGDITGPLIGLLREARTTPLHALVSPTLSALVRRLRCAFEILLEARASGTEGDVAVHYGLLDVTQLGRMVAQAFEDLARSRGVTFNVTLPAKLEAHVDVRRLEIAMLNLLFNAFKHTPLRGAVGLCVREHETRPEFVVRVVDSGASIPSSQVLGLFDRERQIERNVFAVANGIQLNLGVSNDGIRLQGGSLRVFRPPEGGAGFEAILPRWAPEGFECKTTPTIDSALHQSIASLAALELEEESAIGSASGDTSRPAVVLVEHSRSVHRLLRAALSDYCVYSAFDGVSGLQLIRTQKPDLVIADFSVPLLSGDLLVRALLDSPETAHTPVMMLISSEHHAQAVELLDAGCDVLRRPFLVKEVHARARRHVDNKRVVDLLNATMGHWEADLVKLAEDVSQQQHHLQTTLAELDQARIAVETASTVKTNFLRLMSHELKTPITAVQLHVRVLEQDPEVKASGHLKEALSRISRSARRLTHMVETALQWSRIEGGALRMNCTPVDLRLLLDEVVGELESLAHQKEVRFVVTGESVIAMADRRLTRLLMYNAIERAVQITTDGAVLVDLRSSGRYHCVNVVDGAPPITQGDDAEVFDPLTIVDLHHRGGAGSGLGLHVVRDIARALGGDATLSPGVERGNTLTLTLSTALSEGQENLGEPR